VNVTETLAAGGIVRPAEVLELAAAARLDLACAATLLAKESGGGRNVWGHDPVPTGGAYVKGAVVTRDSYAAYRAARAKGTAGAQGVGPTQLTYEAFQVQADRAGGCWDWRANCLTGFGVLAALIRVHGERDGFRRYNGAGPAAERYADDAVTRVATWRRNLSAASPAPQEDDVTPDDIEKIARRAAELVWQRPTVNAKGGAVPAEGILAAAEGRAWDVQDRVYDILGIIRAGVPAAAPVDLDALAERVVERIAGRLQK